MPENASTCPSCGKLRKDIYEDKNWAKVFEGIVGFAGILFVVGMLKGAWSKYSLLEWERFSFESFFGSAAGKGILLMALVGVIGSIFFETRADGKMDI